MFSLCQVTFTVGRFVGVILLQWIDPALMLTIHAVMCVLACTLVATLPGWGAVGFLYVLFYFESICYPVSVVEMSGNALYLLELVSSAYSHLARKISVYTLKEDPV